MDIIYVIMLVFMTGSFCVISFLIGAGRGNGRTRINLNPIEAYKEHKEQKEQDKAWDLKQRQLAAEYRNIDRYDGTSRGQEDIPNE
ncbi:MAG: hypothetical protein IJ272_04640 [Clostridia bacterium]|nr:hypothetical protein [Clostridia bacterium]